MPLAPRGVTGIGAASRRLPGWRQNLFELRRSAWRRLNTGGPHRQHTALGGRRTVLTNHVTAPEWPCLVRREGSASAADAPADRAWHPLFGKNTHSGCPISLPLLSVAPALASAIAPAPGTWLPGWRLGWSPGAQTSPLPGGAATQGPWRAVGCRGTSRVDSDMQLSRQASTMGPSGSHRVPGPLQGLHSPNRVAGVSPGMSDTSGCRGAWAPSNDPSDGGRGQCPWCAHSPYVPMILARSGPADKFFADRQQIISGDSLKHTCRAGSEQVPSLTGTGYCHFGTSVYKMGLTLERQEVHSLGLHPRVGQGPLTELGIRNSGRPGLLIEQRASEASLGRLGHWRIEAHTDWIQASPRKLHSRLSVGPFRKRYQPWKGT